MSIAGNQSKISKIIIFVMFGMIIFGFVVSGFQRINFPTHNNEVASVDGTPITYKEYQQAISQLASQYSQMLGGKELTAKQIEQFQLKEAALDRLKKEKMILNLSEINSFKASQKEVADFIKTLPYFQQNNQFDVNMYKSLLKMNNMSTADFESNIAENIVSQKFLASTSILPVSQNEVQSQLNIKNNGLKVTALKLDHSNLRKLIAISDAELATFFAQEGNEAKIKAIYDRQISQYETPEKRQASHILISINEKQDEEAALKKAIETKQTLNLQNFATVAKKVSDDPGSKDKGGELPLSAKGMMVEEFDGKLFSMKTNEISEPIKTSYGYHLILLKKIVPATKKEFSEVKNSLATEQMRISKNDQHNELIKQTTSDLEKLLKEDNWKAIEALKDKVGLVIIKDKMINPLNTQLGNIQINSDQINKILSDKKQNEVYKFEEPASTSFVKSMEIVNQPKQLNEEELKKETANMAEQNGKLFSENFMKLYEQKVKVKTYL